MKKWNTEYMKTRQRNNGQKKSGASFFENGCVLFEKRMHPIQKEVSASCKVAQVVNNGHVIFEELYRDIAKNCTLTSADVKAVLDRMNYELDKNLRITRSQTTFERQSLPKGNSEYTN
jgi:hypothetical protein